MKYYNDVREMIGDTPMLKLNNLGIKSSVNIFAKLEYENPGGSTKDRIGIAMIEKAEKAGELKKGYSIIEATAGNTGVGVALAAINKGYNVVFVVPEKFSIEKQAVMKALGAKIVSTPEEKGIEGAVEVAEELLRTTENSISLKQSENLENPNAHYRTTGKEIYEDLDGNIDYLVAGAGSGGTFTGIMKYLKEKNSNIKGVLADPIGSILGGGSEGNYDIEGIGNHFIPKTFDRDYVDIVEKISDENALYYAREVARKEGVLAGISSGAALAAAIRLSEKIDSGNIVVVFPDRGERYFSKDLYKTS